MTAQLPYHFRQRIGHEQATTLELFFDLVYVFAITQLAATLFDELTPTGVLHTVMLLLVMWWAWVDVTWMANWFDPETIAVRVVLIVIMLLSLLMAVGIPRAFGATDLLFAGSYAGMMIFRSGAALMAEGLDRARRVSFARMFVWHLFAAIPWLMGAFVQGHAREYLWGLGLGITIVAPLVRFWTPVLGASSTSDWDIEPNHFVERFQLLVIVALGESVVVLGSLVSKLPTLTISSMIALMVGFGMTVSLWWMYFDFVGPASARKMAVSDDVGRLARDAYTYIHLPIVAGIIVYSTSLRGVIRQPDLSLAHQHSQIALAVVGPFLYLIGLEAFRRIMTGAYSGGRLAVTFLLIASTLIAPQLTELQYASLLLLIVGALTIWQTVGVRSWYRKLPVDQRPYTLVHLERTIREPRKARRRARNRR